MTDPCGTPPGPPAPGVKASGAVDEGTTPLSKKNKFHKKTVFFTSLVATYAVYWLLIACQQN